MRRFLVTCILVLLAATSAHAAVDPEFIWYGGGFTASDEARPGYYGETFISLGEVEGLDIYCEPSVTLRHEKLGMSLGGGARTEVLSGDAIAGFNIFYDYTDENDHQGFGAGMEFFHSRFSGHLNIYLPITDRKGREEALPGIELTAGIPVPDAAFITLWPSLYYFNGDDEDDMKGISFTVRVKPVSSVTLKFGGRNDALSSGRDESEIFAGIDIAIPAKRLGKNLFRFDRGEYPVPVYSQADHPVERQKFITIEKKSNPWDLFD